MYVYRIVKSKKRAADLSGMGAYLEGGRWNSEGTFALYTSENPALALLEILVHLDESELPPDLYVMTIEINEKAPVYSVKDIELPKNWRLPENFRVKQLGDRLLKEGKHVALKVRSAVLPSQFNYIINPLYHDFAKAVKIIKTELLDLDERLIRK